MLASASRCPHLSAMKCIAFLVALVTAVAAIPTATTGETATGTLTARQAAGSCSGDLTKFKLFGVSESSAEFGTAIPGTLGTDYTWPSPSSIDYFVGLGFNTFRIPFMLERLAPPATGIAGPFDQTYLSGLQTVSKSMSVMISDAHRIKIVNYITGKGAYALIDGEHRSSHCNSGEC